ncbi:MAG TPA: hypothetical protein VGT44_09325 [Ktedonobacteraceae bacterium]|nr:hypothetical protein [Ktedonobacteraceae bacterium]
MHDLWGELSDLLLPQRSTPLVPPTQSQPIGLKQAMCAYYGHTWQRIGLSNEKQCTVCFLKGYCPGCTLVAPPDAHLFFCTKHTPASPEQSEVQP